MILLQIKLFNDLSGYYNVIIVKLFFMKVNNIGLL
mgnify:CR=1 FL=1